MRFDAAVVVLIVAVCASPGGAEPDTAPFRVPDPEELNEALAEGLIDYQDYSELMEISTAASLTPADSLFLLQFPDLLVGLPANPLMNPEEGSGHEISPIAPSKPRLQRQELLFRQHNSLGPAGENKRFYRVHGRPGQWAYHGELEAQSPGGPQWQRRAVEYNVKSDSGSGTRLVFGSFKETIGMGVMYGYHGRLFSKSADGKSTVRFIYPSFGGANGVLAAIANGHREMLIIYDTDRNEQFAKHMAAVSVPLTHRSFRITVSGGYGNLRNRSLDKTLSATFLSLHGEKKTPGLVISGEAVVSHWQDRFPPAAALNVAWNRAGASARFTGWTYRADYPAFFAGGPSSRRARAERLDDIDLSYSDRYRGETGVILKSTQLLTSRLQLSSAISYAVRDFNDDRGEVRLGLTRSLDDTHRLKIGCYWRRDRLYSDRYLQRRVQIEIIRLTGGSTSRLVLGHRYDSDSGRDDFLVLVENRWVASWGIVGLICKLDRLRPQALQNEYLYVTAMYDTRLNRYLASVVKYSYRYRRDVRDDRYGMIRWDIRCEI